MCGGNQRIVEILFTRTPFYEHSDLIVHPPGEAQSTDALVSIQPACASVRLKVAHFPDSAIGDAVNAHETKWRLRAEAALCTTRGLQDRHFRGGPTSPRAS
jgi:hypothetical protein